MGTGNRTRASSSQPDRTLDQAFVRERTGRDDSKNEMDNPGGEILKSRKLAAALALLGAATLPGIHRFYLGQPRWGLVYFLLAWKTPVSRIASLAEALWYLFLEDAAFDNSFNQLEDLPTGQVWNRLNPFQRTSASFLTRDLVAQKRASESMSAIATALRDLEQLRQEGLVSDSEFEQKRRTLLAKPQATLQFPLDVNQAGLEDWLQLPNLSIHQARTLSQLSQVGVQFHCLEDIAAALGLSQNQLTSLEPMVQFCYYEADEQTVISPALHLNPNQATMEELQSLPGVTAELANRWLKQRQQDPFEDLPDLSQRLQLPGKEIQVLMHYLKF